MIDIGGLLAARARSAGSSAIRDLLHLLDRPGMLSLAGGLPAAEGLAIDPFRAAFDRALQREGPYGPAALQYGQTEGVVELRALVAERAHAVDGRTTVDDVVVTTGSQQAIDLLARVLVEAGDPVVVESPGYLGSLQSLAAVGARMVTVGVDHQGMRTDELEHRLRGGLRPKLCAVVPNFQNPTGATLEDARRVHLAELAERYGFVVIEDDPYRSLHFRGLELAPIRRRTELAVTLGSTSKVLAPGLRVGWAIAPHALRDPLVRAKQAADLHTSTTMQYLALELLADRAAMDTHLPQLRRLYTECCVALCQALRRHVEHAAFVEPEGGFFLWLTVAGVDTDALLPTSLDNGVAFVPGNAFATDGSCTEQLRLSFASLGADQLDEAARRLARALNQRDRRDRPVGGATRARARP